MKLTDKGNSTGKTEQPDSVSHRSTVIDSLIYRK